MCTKDVDCNISFTPICDSAYKMCQQTYCGTDADCAPRHCQKHSNCLGVVSGECHSGECQMGRCTDAGTCLVMHNFQPQDKELWNPYK